ncbi:MAG: hypothetical protein AB7S26_41985 [Sandaracinaceae bacterium]
MSAIQRWVGALCVGALASTGCLPGTGGCDPESALELAYDENGVPAFVGQAMVIQTCGDGAFCHAENAMDRFGAPAGLDYDLRVASTTSAIEPEQATVLFLAQERVLDQHSLIWEQVRGGHMPPQGAVGEAYAHAIASHYMLAHPSGPATELPSLDTSEGRGRLRNWIACGAPVVERTVAPAVAEPVPVGFTVPTCVSTCIDATWESIHAEVIVPTCATSNCHDTASMAGELDLSGDLASVHARVLATSAQGLLCRTRGGPLVTPGDPAMSLLYVKTSVDAPGCGVRMPPAGSPLNDQRRCAVAAWITCGACLDANDAACAACVESHRAECQIPAGGTSGECTSQVQCPATFDPNR